MSNLNYEKFMSLQPTSFGKMTNSLGQEIEFFEHPIHGDSAPVCCACHDLKLVVSSDFFETDDMKAAHKEYEPKFIDGEFWHGDIKAD